MLHWAQPLRFAGGVTRDRELADRLSAALEGTTLDALCRDAARNDVKRAHPEAPMYFI